MELGTHRAARSAYLVFAGLTALIAAPWVAAAWKTGTVTWTPLTLLALAYGAWALWLSRFRIEFSADELRVATPFGGERWLARSDILAVEFVAPARRKGGLFTLAIRVRDGSDLRLNAKLFPRETVQRLLELAPRRSA